MRKLGLALKRSSSRLPCLGHGSRRASAELHGDRRGPRDGPWRPERFVFPELYTKGGEHVAATGSRYSGRAGTRPT